MVQDQDRTPGTTHPPSPHQAIIGIVGGVGPYAGLDLQAKILAETPAVHDQDHLPVIAISQPGEIPDRTAFLLGETTDNPAEPILRQLRLLSEMGATVAAIPCNTAHAAPIFDVIEAGVAGFDRPLRLLHMIREMTAHLKNHHPGLRRIGVLSTTGAYTVRLYPHLLEPLGYEVVVPSEAIQRDLIHPAIYDTDYGIKALGRATDQARADLLEGVTALRAVGAEAVVLGCTELPLALPEPAVDGLPLIDPTRVLARALVEASGRRPRIEQGSG